MSYQNSKMSENLLNTLDALKARDELSAEATNSFEANTNKETGEWTGEPPDGYKPMEAPEIKVTSKETNVKEFEHSDARTDYIRVRDTTYALQEATMLMLGEAAKLAAATEAPRAFSVFKELGELMRGLNKDLMENQKSFKSVTMGEEPKTNDEGETEISVESDGKGGTRVTVGKTTQRRTSRDLMEVANRVRQEQEDKRKEEEQRRRDAEAVDVDVEDVEEKPNADDASATTTSD